MAKVMLVEDDNNLREIYEARLAAEGYEIVAAQDGEEALALAVKERPDLIIADIMMPKVSGFDMLDILRSTPETKHAKIIMMTALSQAEDKARAEKLGADRYLVKSQVTLEDVVKVASEMLSSAENTPDVQSAPTPSITTNDAVSDSPTIPSSSIAVSDEPTQSAPTPVVAEEPAAASMPADDTTTVAPTPTDDAASDAPAAVPPAPAPIVNPGEPTHTPGTTIAPDGANETTTSAEDTTTEAQADAASDLSNPTSEEKAEVTEQIDDFISQNPTLSTSAEPEKEEEEASDTPTPATTEVVEGKPAAEEAEVETPTEPSTIVEEPLVVEETAPAPAPDKPVTTSIPITIADEGVKEEPFTDKETGDTDADQTMAKAVDNLMGKDSSSPEESSPVPEPAEESKEPQLAKKRGGERVITPLSDPRTSGPDLDALLAKEEENNAIDPPPANAVIAPGGSIVDPASSEESAVVDPVTDASSGTVVPAPPSEEETPPTVNPNNIAL